MSSRKRDLAVKTKPFLLRKRINVTRSLSLLERVEETLLRLSQDSLDL
jgi:hypothetical protein